VPRLRRTAFAIGTAACMAAAFAAAMTAPASARTTASAPAAVSAPATAADAAAAIKPYAAVAGNQACSDDNGDTGAPAFWRCTGPNATSAYAGSGCGLATYELNATGHWNVYGYINGCEGRVWLHQYTYPTDEKSGWSVCLNGYSSGFEYSPYNAPENIEITTNDTNCP
jgi:hypothetical protein